MRKWWRWRSTINEIVIESSQWLYSSRLYAQHHFDSKEKKKTK